jgi:hypothetical protein
MMGDMVIASDDDDDDDMDPMAQATTDMEENIKKGKCEFDTSKEDEHGNWRASGELRKKKAGKKWKVRYCHIVSHRTLPAVAVAQGV